MIKSRNDYEMKFVSDLRQVGGFLWTPGTVDELDCNLVMLIYVLRWRPSWIFDRHKKQKFGKGHSNDHSFTVWVQSVH